MHYPKNKSKKKPCGGESVCWTYTPALRYAVALKQVTLYAAPWLLGGNSWGTSGKVQKQNNVSLLVVVPMLTNIKKWHKDDSNSTKALKSKLVEEIERKWRVSDTNEASVLSAIIDPRFKQLNWLSGEEKEQVYTEVSAWSYMIKKRHQQLMKKTLRRLHQKRGKRLIKSENWSSPCSSMMMEKRPKEK